MKNAKQGIDSDLLNTFAVVAETRHFTRAAERLGCGQSAVSMQIRRLEDSLQVRLLHRSKRDVKLTPEGEILLRHAHQVARLTDRALAEIGRPSGTGRIRIGATDTSMIYLPPVLQQFYGRYPGIDVVLRCDRSWEALDLLEAGDIDVAFVTQRCGRDGGELISRSRLVWACAAHSDVAEREPVPLAVFGPGCIYRKAIVEALDRCGKGYHLAYESSGRAGLQCAVDAGLAVTTVTRESMTDNLRVIEAGQLGFPALPILETFLFGASPEQPLPIRAFASLLSEVLATDSQAPDRL